MEIDLGGNLKIMALRRRHKRLKKDVWPGRGHCLVSMRKNGEIAAFAFVRRRKDKETGAREDFIHVIEVLDPAERRRGIGTALVAAVIESARHRRSCQVRAYFDGENIASRQLWLKCGFELSAEGPGFFATYKL